MDWDGSQAATRALPLREPALQEIASELEALGGLGGDELLQELEQTNPHYRARLQDPRLCCRKEETARIMEAEAAEMEARDPELARGLRENARWLREDADDEEAEAVARLHVSSPSIEIDVSDLGYVSLPVERGGVP